MIALNPLPPLWERVNPNFSKKNVLKSSDLDWEIKSVPHRALVINKAKKVLVRPVRDSMVCYRSDNSEILGIQSKRFNPVQPEQPLHVANEIARKTDGELVSAGTIQKGAYIW